MIKNFCVSDVHGQFDKMIEALDEAGFDRDNENHRLITLGDMFDRGKKSKEIYWYLKGLDRVINIHGNHDKFLIDFLGDPNDTTAYFNVEYNGLDVTLASMANITKAKARRLVNEEPMYLKAEINKHNKGIYKWLMDMPMYYETKTHILVHAGLYVWSDKDWRNSSYKDFCWHHDFMLKHTNHIDKTIVFGHMWAWANRIACAPAIGAYNSDIDKEIRRYGMKATIKPDPATYYFENKVCIDGCSNIDWGVVNVYVFEDEDLEEEK